MFLFSRQDLDESLEIGDASPGEKVDELTIAVTWLYHVDKMFSLWPRDTADINKFSDKRSVSD